MKQIYYFGEERDYSDRWILRFLKKHFRVVHINPESKMTSRKSCNLIINRLYGSAVSRYGKMKICRLIKNIENLEAMGVPSINSSRGYLFDLDRISQYKFFTKYNLQFVKTVMATSVLSKKENIRFPCVLKNNSLSRNKRLLIINNRHALVSIPNLSGGGWVLQRLIRNGLCYRTEFIGSDSFTFMQRVEFHDDGLTFEYKKSLVKTPLDFTFQNRLKGAIVKMGIRVFSVEYFLKSGQPSIVDFNMTSNYPHFFINKTKGRLENAWLGTVNNEII